MNNFWKVWAILFVTTLIILTASFVFKFNLGSNADIPQSPQYEAIIICTGMFSDNVTMTWEYPHLNESDSYQAYIFASENNCTFKSSKFTIKELVMKGGKNETE